eukprot:IDg15628t1
MNWVCSLKDDDYQHRKQVRYANMESERSKSLEVTTDRNTTCSQMQHCMRGVCVCRAGDLRVSGFS